MIFLATKVKYVEYVAFAAMGDRLLTSTSLRHLRGNRGIQVWQPGRVSKPVDCLFPKEELGGFITNPSGHWTYAAVGLTYRTGEMASSYRACHMATGSVVDLGLTPGQFNLAVHPTGEWFTAGGGSADWRMSYLVKWKQPPGDAPQLEWRLTIEPGWVGNLACDPSGARIITRDCRGGLVTQEVFELSVRDSNTGDVIERVPVPGRTVEDLKFSPDGASLVVRAGPSLLVYDARRLTGKPRKVRGGWKQLTAVAFHPSGRYLAATSNDQTVKLYDTQTWELAKTYTWDIGRMRSIAFSPDGLLAAAGSDTGKVVVWDVDV